MPFLKPLCYAKITKNLTFRNKAFIFIVNILKLKAKVNKNQTRCYNIEISVRLTLSRFVFLYPVFIRYFT